MSFTRVILAAGLALGACLPLATASGAETTIIRRGEDGPSVAIRRHDDRGWHRGWDHRRYEAYGMERCRTVTIRHENDHGDVIIKRMRKCS